MLEVLQLRLINWVEKLSEKKREGAGILFVPASLTARDISEAMLLDGSLPSEINQFLIESAPEFSRDGEASAIALRATRLREIRESLILAGEDGIVLRQTILEIERDLGPIVKTPILLPYDPRRSIDLSAYQE